MAAAFLALPPSLGFVVIAGLFVPLMTAQTVPLLLPRCREVSGGGEGGSCWAEWRTALPDDRSGGWQRQPDAGDSPRARSPWPTWLWGTAFSSCLVTLPAPGPPIQARDDRRPRWLHLSDLRDCPCRRFRAPSARSHGLLFLSFLSPPIRRSTLCERAAKMTTTKGPETCRRAAGAEPGTPACLASCTRHYWLTCRSLSPSLFHDSHTPLIQVFGRAWETRVLAWEAEGARKGSTWMVTKSGALTGGEARATTDAETRSYFRPAITPTHLTRCDAPFASSRIPVWYAPLLPPRDGSTAACVWSTMQQCTKIGERVVATRDNI